MSTAAAQDFLVALRASHDRLSTLVDGLDEVALEGPSYDTEWSLAQLLSHLGSQAEIMDLFLVAVADGTDVPGGEAFPPIWNLWNSRATLEQRDFSLEASETHIARLEAMSDAEIGAWRISMFGMDLDLAGFLRMRLFEHVLHTWDAAVMADPAAKVSADAVALLVDGLGMTVARGGTATGESFRVRIGTSDPVRDLVVVVGEPVALEEASPDEPYDGAVDLPAEALLRLVTGRLDLDHTPPHSQSGRRGLSDLRAVFPGI